MTPQQVQLVRASFARLVPVAETAAELFYHRLFETAPETRGLFRHGTAEQGRRLMVMLDTVVRSLGVEDQIVPLVFEMGRRHATYGVSEKDIRPFGDALLWTLGRVLGKDFTPEVEAAWSAAYGYLADIMREAMPPQARSA